MDFAEATLRRPVEVSVFRIGDDRKDGKPFFKGFMSKIPTVGEPVLVGQTRYLVVEWVWHLEVEGGALRNSVDLTVTSPMREKP